MRAGRAETLNLAFVLEEVPSKLLPPMFANANSTVLEALTIEDKIKTLESIISFYLHDINFNNQTVQ